MDAGIYAIYNTANDKLYIGSAVSLRKRFVIHKYYLQRDAHHSRHLQGAWNKHGSAAFEFGCLEAVDCKSKLREREQAWLDTLKTWHPEKGYNISQTAGSLFGFRHSDETIAKMQRRKPSAETRARMSLAGRGRPRSAEHAANLSAAQKGRKPPNKGVPMSIAQKAKLSLVKKGKLFSPEHKAAISKAGMGRKVTEETRAKMSLAAMNRSDEYKAKQSLSQRRRRAAERASKTL